MNKFAKLAIGAAAAVMAASAMPQNYVQTAPGPITASQQTVNNNWVNGSGECWKNGSDELCLRDAYWTPATANAKCDGSIIAQVSAPAPVTLVSRKITYQADALFDFDKAILKPAGKQKLDDLVDKVQALNLEVVVAIGYTDRIGSDEYNDLLSLHRAQAVKAYLVSNGVEANRVYTEGKGKRHPVTTDCTQKNRTQLISCLAPDRRVEVEVVGTNK